MGWDSGFFSWNLGYNFESHFGCVYMHSRTAYYYMHTHILYNINSHTYIYREMHGIGCFVRSRRDTLNKEARLTIIWTCLFGIVFIAVKQFGTLHTELFAIGHRMTKPSAQSILGTTCCNSAACTPTGKAAPHVYRWHWNWTLGSNTLTRSRWAPTAFESVTSWTCPFLLFVWWVDVGGAFGDLRA